MRNIRTVADWDEVRKKSIQEPIVVFKYSKTCLSSLSAIKEMRKLEHVIQIYIIVVQSAREVSNAVELELKVKHESPQVLLVKEGRAVWQATHYKIKATTVDEAITTYL